MRSLQVFDPPMCCSTGVCGPEVDPTLVQFAADLDSLQDDGVKIERFSLSQNPNQFATTPAVLTLLKTKGADALPAILADGRLVHSGSYPDIRALRAMVAALPENAAPPSSIDRAYAALDGGRAVFLVHGDDGEFIKPFRAVAVNPAFCESVVLLELSNDREPDAALMQEAGLAAGEVAAVLIAPPGRVIAHWRGTADEGEVLIRALQASQPSSCCSPGGSSSGSCCS